MFLITVWSIWTKSRLVIQANLFTFRFNNLKEVRIPKSTFKTFITKSSFKIGTNFFAYKLSIFTNGLFQIGILMFVQTLVTLITETLFFKVFTQR